MSEIETNPKPNLPADSLARVYRLLLEIGKRQRVASLTGRDILETGQYKKRPDQCANTDQT